MSILQRQAVALAVLVLGIFLFNLGGFIAEREATWFEPVPTIGLGISLVGMLGLATSYSVARPTEKERIFRILILIFLILNLLGPLKLLARTVWGPSVGGRLNWLGSVGAREDIWVAVTGLMCLCATIWLLSSRRPVQEKS